MTKSKPTGRDLLAENLDGESVLKTDKKLLPLTIKETVDRYMSTVLDRLSCVPTEDWTSAQLQEVIQTILVDITPHPKMVESAWRQKHLDLHLSLRWALAAGFSGPSNSVLMEILGKAISLQRLEHISTTSVKHADNP